MGRRMSGWVARALHVAATGAVVLGAAAIVSADVPLRERTTVYPSWAYDVSDDTLLVGASTHVFFGTVLSVTAGPPLVTTDPDDPDGPVIDQTPQTLYEVRAVGDIKGNLSSLPYAPNTFPVIQIGGYDDTGTLVLFENDTVMNVGSTYLLITRRYRLDDQPAPAMSSSGVLCAVCGPTDASAYHLIAPGYDHKLADTPEQRAALGSQYQAAAANEVNPVPLIEE